MGGFGIENIQDIKELFLRHDHTGSRLRGVKLNGDALNDLQDTKGIVLVSANGTRYRLGVDNDGALTTTKL